MRLENLVLTLGYCFELLELTIVSFLISYLAFVFYQVVMKSDWIRYLSIQMTDVFLHFYPSLKRYYYGIPEAVASDLVIMSLVLYSFHFYHLFHFTSLSFFEFVWTWIGDGWFGSFDFANIIIMKDWMFENVRWVINWMDFVKFVEVLMVYFEQFSGSYLFPQIHSFYSLFVFSF